MRIPRFNSRSLQDPQSRRQLVEQAIVDAKSAYRLHSPEAAREPILRLQDQFDEAGLDRLELLFHAESNLPADPYWLLEIVTILMRKQSLSPRELPYLQRQASLTPTRLDIWNRLFRERRGAGDEDSFYQDREACALALLPYFPVDGSEHRWPDNMTVEDAYNLMCRALVDAAINVIGLKRVDARARVILQAAYELYPDRKDFRLQLSRILAQENDRTPAAVGMVMETILEEPAEIGLRLWVASCLLDNPRLSSQGLAMFRQLWQENPTNRELFDRYLSAIKAGDSLEDDDEAFIAEYVKQTPNDLRALEMLADQYVARSLLSEEALRIYKAAAAHSPKRRNYLRLMGRFYASRSEWSDVIAIFDEVRQGGNDTEEVIFPLAMAYAEFSRTDGDAREVYRRAIELGTLMPEVHSMYCRMLYQEAPTAPDSVAQFTQSLALVPGCLWAQLGMILHYLQTGDAGRALESAAAILNNNPMDREAMKLAGRALAQDFSRRQLARLAGLKSFTLGHIFEEAYLLAPDAGPIALGLARHRVANNVTNHETVRLLGDVCRRNPDAMDLRVARADMLWDLGQEPNAASLYRELLERWRGGALPRGVPPESRKRILLRVANFILQPPGPSEGDLEILLDATGDPDCPAEVVLGTARALVDLEVDHPEKLQLLSLATRLAPGDEKLKRAAVEGFAAKGNPRPAIEHAIRMIEAMEADEEIINLLRSVMAVTKPEALTSDLIESLQEALHTSGPPPALLLAGMEVVFMGRTPTSADIVLLEALGEIFPRNVKVKRWMARALNESGQEREAAELLKSLAHEVPEDDEVILELAKTHARLGKHDRENLKVAEIAARIDPMNTELQLHLAAIELNMKSYAQAARRLIAVMQVNPDIHPRIAGILEQMRSGSTESPEILFLLAEVHIRAQRIDQAISLLARLQANYQQHYARLIDLYDRIIVLARDNPRPLIERGILYRLIGEIDHAVDDFRSAYRISPDNNDVASEFADVLAQKVHSQQPPQIAECLEAANVYLDLGDEENCFDMVEAALSADSTNQEALLLLAKLQLNAGALSKAQATVKQLQDRKEALALLQQLARAFAEEGDHLQAAQVLTEALEAAGPQREILEELRSLHHQQAKSNKDATQRLRVLHSLSNRAQSRYELREEIGHGSMGMVYKAYDRELDEIVVLKILPEHFANNEEALARFRHEAKAARKLAHPNIVRIHDFGEEGGRKHISMEYVSGGDLKSWLAKNGKPSTEEAIRIIREVARALGHAHSEGVLHRDIKTANILLTSSGRVKLSDFGIAALTESTARDRDATGGSTAGLAGTPLYMSPEQFEGQTLIIPSDLYSLGVMFYELLAGVPPFVKGSIAYHHQFTPPKPIMDIPMTLWNVVEKLLAKMPQERYQSAHELLEALDPFNGRGPNREVTIHDQVTPPFGNLKTS